MELSCCPQRSPPTLPHRAIQRASPPPPFPRPNLAAPSRLSIAGKIICPFPALGSTRGNPNPSSIFFSYSDKNSTAIVSELLDEDSDGAEAPAFGEVSVEEAPVGGGGGGEEAAPADFLNNIDFKLDSIDAYSFLIYGAGSLVALWITSAIVGALDSIPLFPKVMEVVGLGFTIWFSARYLVFKENREELFKQIESLREQIIGSDDE